MLHLNNSIYTCTIHVYTFVHDWQSSYSLYHMVIVCQYKTSRMTNNISCCCGNMISWKHLSIGYALTTPRYLLLQFQCPWPLHHHWPLSHQGQSPWLGEFLVLDWPALDLHSALYNRGRQRQRNRLAVKWIFVTWLAVNHVTSEILLKGEIASKTIKKRRDRQQNGFFVAALIIN